jgi:adenosylcobinamide hydrolase
MIPGITVGIDAEGVVVKAATPLLVASSAMAGGGVVEARAILNVHVDKHGSLGVVHAALDTFARRHGVTHPYVGLLTAASTEKAETASATHAGFSALAVVTVGLSNRTTAGVSPPAACPLPSTINTIVIVEADAPPAALINAMMTITEVKTLALIEAGVKGADGHPATGTSTDALAVAATRRGPPAQFGGPVSDLGWVVARAAGPALRRGIARWIAERG